MENRYVERLQKQGIKPTSIRMLLLRAIIDKKKNFSISDLEAEMKTIDKSTISRVFKLFTEHNLIHYIYDGSGSLKYSVCDEGCDCSISYQHVHFYCTKCKQTICLRNTPLPTADLPEGFTADSISYVVKGCCNRCSKFAT
jgi:Fur family ferric uptake transcriptional regulator